MLETLQLFRDPQAFGRRRFRRYGPVSRMSLYGKNAAILFGAEANRYVLVTHFRNFTWREGFARSVPLFGDAIALVDGDVHARQRRLMTPAFHGRHMPSYLERMNRVIEAKLATFPRSGTRKLYHDVREIAFRLSASLLVGLEVGDDYERLNHLWGILGRGVTSLLQLDLPFTDWGRALRARKELDRFLRRIIRERRDQQGADAASLLIHGKDEAGQGFTEDELCDQIKFLIAAGYDTTASTTGWLLVELLRHPAMLARVQAEVGADKRDAPLSLEDLRDKPFLDAAIKETLRLYPQNFIAPRGVVDDFELGGYRIPRSFRVLLMTAYTHRMPQYFRDPDAFDPERFLPPRDEEARTPYAFTGFGGGPRICIGATVAQLEIKAIVTRLLRRFELTLVKDQDLRPVYVPVPRARSDVLVTVRAK